jgi:hypothetical protein
MSSVEELEQWHQWADLRDSAVLLMGKPGHRGRLTALDSDEDHLIVRVGCDCGESWVGPVIFQGRMVEAFEAHVARMLPPPEILLWPKLRGIT